MRVLVQRVEKASVEVEGRTVGKIGAGFLLLVSFTQNDNEEIIDSMIKKILGLRIFDDEQKIMNKNIQEVHGEILSISQFTLYADTKKGNRPSYIQALNGNLAIHLYDSFNQKLQEHIKVGTGIFGSDMKVSLVNDGPVTIMLEK